VERLAWVLEGLGSALPALAAGLIVVVYGAVCARLMGVRSWLLALAASISIGVPLLAVPAQLTAMLGVSIPIPVDAVIGLSLAAVLGLVVLRWLPRRTTSGAIADPTVVVWAGVVIGVLVTLAVWIGGIGDHALPPQGHDDIWHGYLVERLTHMPVIGADTVAPTDPINGQPVLYYQYGLHLAWAFGHMVAGVTVPEMLNGGWIVHVALLLPVGAAALAWSFFPGRPWVAFWAAVLAPSVVVFPYLTNGLLPYTASLAMIPGLLALLVIYLRGEHGVPSWAPALAAVGIFVTHPSGAVVAAIAGAAVAAEILVANSRRGQASAVVRRLVTVGAIATLAGLPWLLAAGDRGLGAAPAIAEVDLATAISRVVLLGTPWTSPQPVLALLAGAGLVATVVGRRAIGVSVAFLAFAILSIGTMAGVPSFAALTQPWHAHWFRIAGAFGVLIPVLAGLGMASLIGVVRARISARSEVARRLATAATTAMVAIAMIGAAYASAQGQSIVRTAWHASGLVQPPDIELFDELSDLTGNEDRVFNSPRDGSGWMYAIAGVIPRHPYAYGTPQSSWDLVNGVPPYDHTGAACDALVDEGVTYAVVKMTAGTVAESDAYDIAGFVDRHPELFDEVARTESAVAYRIDQAALAECAKG
jgi:hypothetical protein